MGTADLRQVLGSFDLIEVLHDELHRRLLQLYGGRVEVREQKKADRAGHVDSCRESEN